MLNPFTLIITSIKFDLLKSSTEKCNQEERRGATTNCKNLCNFL
jgi:hypothetical protein